MDVFSLQRGIGFCLYEGWQLFESWRAMESHSFICGSTELVPVVSFPGTGEQLVELQAAVRSR